MRMLKINKYYTFITLIIFFNLQGLYLLDADTFRTSDIAVVLEIAFILYVAIKGGYKGQSRYKILMLLPVALMLTSSISAYLHYGQPLLYGIRAQRAWISAMLMYFPLSGLLRNEKITIEHIVKILDRIIFAYMLLVIIQFFLGTKIVFLHLSIGNRFGSVRLYISTTFVLLMYFIHLYKIIEKRNARFFDALIVGCVVFIYLFVAKSRMGLAALILATAFAVFSARFSGRKLIFICIGLFGAAIFMISPYGQMVFDSMFGSTAQDAGTAIRDVGRIFYIEQTLSTKLYALFGSGYANLDWQPTVIATRYLDGIYYNDNGIIGLFFYYGFAMVAWTIAVHIKVMKDAWKSNTREVFMYLISSLIGVYTLFPYSYVRDISFAIALAFVEKQVLDNQSERLK